jgi:hypothetical protein
LSKLNLKTINTFLFDPAGKRLMLAMIVSFLLHVLLVVKAEFLGLPNPLVDTLQINVHLMPLPPKQQRAVPSIEETKQVLPETKPAPPSPVVPEALAEAEPVPEVVPSADAPPEVPPPSLQTEHLAADETPVLERQDEVVETNEDEAKPIPYRVVETRFDVFMNGEEARVGEAMISYAADMQLHYRLRWELKATGLLGLVYPDLVQTSEGLVTPLGLQPQSYYYQFGNKADKSYQAHFDWTGRKVTLQSAKGDKVMELADDTQDFLSFMYQFMYVPPLSAMQVHLTNGKKLSLYDYVFEGEEVLELKFANVRTYHIKHAKGDSEDKTELWLALDYQNLPVKIRKTEKNGTVIEQVAVSIQTSQQPIETITLP